MNPLVHTIAETCVLARAGRTAIYEAIKSGKLIAHKRGSRTVIFACDLQRWINSLPQIALKNPVERHPSSGAVASRNSGGDPEGGDAVRGNNRASSNVGA